MLNITQITYHDIIGHFKIPNVTHVWIPVILRDCSLSVDICPPRAECHIACDVVPPIDWI